MMVAFISTFTPSISTSTSSKCATLLPSISPPLSPRPRQNVFVGHRQRKFMIAITSSSSSSPSPSSSDSSRLPLPSQSPSKTNVPKRTRAKQPAGGKGPLSANFLSVSGTLATIITLFLLYILFIFPKFSTHILPTNAMNQDAVLALLNRLRPIFLVFISFSQGILISRFDLNRIHHLKLTIAFTILLRIIITPILSHCVAFFVHNLFPSILDKQLISSFFLISTTPIFLSPCLSMLLTYINPTLLSLLLISNHFIFPFSLHLSYKLACLAQNSSWLNIRTLLPIIDAPPNILTLFITTTLPFFSGILFNRTIRPRRAAAIIALLSLPFTWCITLLLSFIDCYFVSFNFQLTPFLAALGLSGGVSIALFLLARLLAKVLLLKGRARRSIILFVCTPGVTVASGLIAKSMGMGVVLVSAGVALIATSIMARTWSHVVIRTRNDVM